MSQSFSLQAGGKIRFEKPLQKGGKVTLISSCAPPVNSFDRTCIDVYDDTGNTTFHTAIYPEANRIAMNSLPMGGPWGREGNVPFKDHMPGDKPGEVTLTDGGDVWIVQFSAGPPVTLRKQEKLADVVSWYIAYLPVSTAGSIMSNTLKGIFTPN